MDATNVSISAYVPQWQLEDNVFQQGENDTGVILGHKYDNSIYVGLTNFAMNIARYGISRPNHSISY